MAEQINDDSAYTEVRLPSHCVPSHYDLALTPNLVELTFEGVVKIDYTSTKSTDTVVLHADELVIQDGYINDPTTVKLVKVLYSKTTETASLVFSGAIPESGKLFLHFTGVLNDKMKGFYRTAYKDSAGKTFYAATSKFEPTHARRALPCWDEPAIKARFSTTLKFNSDDPKPAGTSFTALSNTEVCSTSTDGKWTSVKFVQSPIMSTYLLVFIVAPLEFISDKAMDRVKVSVYTFPGKVQRGPFALKVARESMEFFENYFQIPYPMSKIDLIAIPDFASGAMENWGAVTFRETSLLVDGANSSSIVKQGVALTVAHELAHQWFGNLVTMEWWTHLWLNEGFATFMEYLCADRLFPDYDVWSQFVMDNLGRALNLDALHNSHPIEVPVQHPSEIVQIFDLISYLKGSSIIRMLYDYVGEESFRKGMHAYLTKYAYKNAVTEQLWEALEEASGQPVRKLMSCWTLQKGFPWVSIDHSYEDGRMVLSLTQNKFSADGRADEDEAKSNWVIPVSAITSACSSQAPTMQLLESKTGRLSVSALPDEWIKLNSGTIGFYRVAYPENLVKKLLPAIENKSLPPSDRLGLQSDFFALCQAGRVSTVDLLKFLLAFKTEDKYPTWVSIDCCIGRLSILFAETDFLAKFKTYARELYADVFKRLGWEPQAGETHTDAMTRALIINRMVALENQSVINEAKSRFRNHLNKSRPISADLRGAVYRAMACYGDEADFEALFEIHRGAESGEEKNRVARVLGFTREPDRLKRVIDFTMSSEVRDQDKFIVFVSFGAAHPSAAWQWLQDNKDWLRQTFEGYIMNYFVKFCTENLCSEEKAQEVARFFEINKFSAVDRTVKQSLETIRLDASWFARDAEAVKAYLSGLQAA